MKLCEFLNENGMKPSHFCNKVGISSTTLHNLLSGQTMPSLRTAIAIYNFTDKKVKYEDMLVEGHNTQEVNQGKRKQK